MKAFYLCSTIVIATISASCSTDASAKDNLVESDDYCINMYNGPKQNFTTDLQIQNEDASGFDLVFTISPGEGAYFASPASNNGWLGLLTINFENSKNIHTDGEFKESPQSVEELDPISNDYVNWVKSKTTYTYRIDVSTKKDFKESGYFAFVIEPECNRYRIDFETVKDKGNFSISAHEPTIENFSN